MISRLRYTLREMWASMSRNKTLTAATVITSTISLLLFGLTLLIQRGFDNQLKLWTGGVEMIVYVKHGAQPDQVQLIQGELERQNTVIESVQYCAEPCATDVANTLFAGDTDSLNQLLPKIPSFFKVKPIDKSSGETLRSLKSTFKQLPNVIDVRTPDQQVEVLSQLKGFFGVRTLIIAGGLLAASGAVDLEHHPHRDVRPTAGDRGDETRGCHQLVHPPALHARGFAAGHRRCAVRRPGLLFLNADWTSGVRAFPASSGLRASSSPTAIPTRCGSHDRARRVRRCDRFGRPQRS